MSAPTPQEHVRHFLATVDDYESMAEIFPLGPDINVFGHRDDHERRWIVAFHAMMLRKYFQSGDALLLKSVVGSLRQCVVKLDLSPDEWASWLTIGDIRNITVYQHGFGKPYGEVELLKVQLYGRYLHGDYEKWAEVQRIGDGGSDTAVFTAVGGMACRVVSLVEFIRGGIDEGAVEL
jgi:hypothetical protein